MNRSPEVRQSGRAIQAMGTACAKAPGGREHFRGTDKRPLWLEGGGREVFLSWASLIPKLRRLEFTLEARGALRRAAGIEANCVFISWLWCGEHLVERIGGKPVRSWRMGESLWILKLRKSSVRELGVWLDV